jgi:uncharacterized protein (TIGR02594 family)
MFYSFSAPARYALLTALGAVIAAVPAQVVAQSFPPPGSLNDFSDTMIETPDTSMAFDPSDVPEVQPDPDYAGTPATVQPELPETGTNNYEGPIGVTGVIDNVTTGCSYSPLSHNALRGPITDIDVPGALGKYGLKMRRYYNSRGSQYWDHAIGLSPGWFHEYSWLLWSGGSKVISAQGNVSDFYCIQPVGVSDGWDDGNQVPHPHGGIWRLADGGKVVFSGGRVTDIYDPYGVRTTIARDGSNRVSRVTEAGGRYLQFTYGTTNAYTDPAYGTKLLQKVEAWDGQGHLIERVTYTYTNVDSGGVIPTNGQHVIRKMLTGVAYDDNTSAGYSYRTDNVPDTPPSTFKFDPLLKSCNDKRYSGPMRQIAYEYQSLGPHGAITKEYKPNGPLVSKIEPDLPLHPTGGWLSTEFTETRGDGPPRTFTYTQFKIYDQHPPDPPDPCLDANNNVTEGRPPQQLLDHFTDFQGHTTQLGYDSNWYINSVTDANNHTTSYERGNPPSKGGIGEIKTITHPVGVGYPASSIHYDYHTETSALVGHYLYHVTDENGKMTTIKRDPTRYWITEIDYPADANTPASYEMFGYNGFGQVTVHLLKNGAWERFAYARGLLTDKWNPQSTLPGDTDPHTHYEYYTSGPWTDRVKTVTMPANWPWNFQATETYEYDKNASLQPCAGRGLVTKITHTDGRYQSFKYDQWGNKIIEWNELGERTDYIYDNYNRVKSVTRANETTTYDYSPTEGGQSYLHTTNSPYWVTLPTAVKTHNVYDENWRKTSASVAGRTTWFHYDLVGNVEYVTDPRGTQDDLTHYTTHTDYDTRNRKWKVWDAQGHETDFTYDNASNVTRIDHLADGSWQTKAYDAVNRVLTDTVPKDNSTMITTTFNYNPSGTINWVKDGNNQQTTFEYDPSDQKTKMTYPDLSFQSWAYDDAHNLKSRTTVNGETKYFAWDNRNRIYIDSWWDPNGGEWRYFGFDAASRLRRAMNGPGTWYDGVHFIADVRRTYDTAGRLTLDQQILSVSDQTTITNGVNYEYDVTLRGGDGKPTRMYAPNIPGGYDYDFRYDDMGRFEKILIHNNASTRFQYSYDNASNETQRFNWITHIAQIYNPDSLNRATTVDLQYNGSRFWLESYDYYPIGRLHTVTRLGNRQDQFNYYLDGELRSVYYDVTVAAEAPDPNENPPAEDPTKEKTVDDFLALPAGMDPGAPQTVARTVTYDLDNAGNRTGVTDSLSGPRSYTPNLINQYTGVQNSTIHNGNDHEVDRYQGPNDPQEVDYTYLRDEHLIRVTFGTNTYDLAYDALGRCVKRTVHTTEMDDSRPTPTPRPDPTPYPRPTPTPDPNKYYIYDGERPILEYASNGTLVGYNLYGKGVDEILMHYDPTLTQEPKTFYYQQDHEGSVTHLTYSPPTGVSPILEYYRYDVFGKPTIYGPPPNWSLRPASLYSNRFLFTGREYNAMFGFYEYRARAYHPDLGRFMSEDPKLFDAGDYNLFRYCHNDPIDFTDPTGLAGEATGLLQGGTHDRLWDMTKWFDSSNTIQGNFVWQGTPYQLQPAKPQELVSIARRQLGITEVPGAGSNPRIIEYLKTTTIDAKAYNDSTAWCSAFVNWVVKQGGIRGTNSAAALSWRRWGEDAHGPGLGAIAVIDHRNGSGHVGFVAGVTTRGRVILLGGNQRDAVRYSVFGTSNIVGYRVPPGSYSGFPVIRNFAPAPVYRDAGAAALEFDSTR